nr:MAG TPA: hypothetical protein [Caudoviricetes sp.]
MRTILLTTKRTVGLPFLIITTTCTLRRQHNDKSY